MHAKGNIVCDKMTQTVINDFRLSQWFNTNVDPVSDDGTVQM
jgi:hypothetical protein